MAGRGGKRFVFARKAAAAGAAAVIAEKRAPLHGAGAEIFMLVSAGATPEQWAEWLRVPLEHAAAAGNHDLFTRLVSAGATCGAGWSGCDGRTLLDAAALGGNVDVVSTVLKKGSRSEVNVLATSPGRSALYTAVKGGHEAAARKLILAGADVNYEDPDDECPPLVAAVRGGCGTVVTDLLLAGASSPDDWEDDDCHSLLQIAAESGHTEVVSALLGADMDVNGSTTPEDGYSTPLMLASSNGHLLTVKTLLVAGADTGLRDGENDDAALDLAAKNGHTDVMQVFLRHGVHVDARCSSGYTALHNAASANQVGAVEVLLDAGADIHAKIDSDGKTPLHCSAEWGQSGTALALLLRGAYVNDVDHDGNTPLHLACRARCSGGEVTAIVDLLLRWGGSEAAANYASQTPLQLLDIYLHGLRRWSGEWERDRAANLTATSEPVRSLLIHAPADRAWRRRCLLVMLRSRNDGRQVLPLPSNCSDKTKQEEEREEHHGLADEESGGVWGAADHEILDAGKSKTKEEEGGRDGRAGAEAAAAEQTRTELADVVVEVMPDPVFRNVVLFL